MDEIAQTTGTAQQVRYNTLVWFEVVMEELHQHPPQEQVTVESATHQEMMDDFCALVTIQNK